MSAKMMPEPGLPFALVELSLVRSCMDNVNDILLRIGVLENMIESGGAVAPKSAVAYLAEAKRYANIALRAQALDAEDYSVSAMLAVDRAWRAQVEIGIPQVQRLQRKKGSRDANNAKSRRHKQDLMRMWNRYRTTPEFKQGDYLGYAGLAEKLHQDEVAREKADAFKSGRDPRELPSLYNVKKHFREQLKKHHDVQFPRGRRAAVVRD